jgi:RNA polymerase sigma factor (TIGR02999 family)
MANPDPLRESTLTSALQELGDEGDFDRILPLVYDELKVLARRQLRRNAANTINTTALVHEAYLRLAKAQPKWANRRHVFAACAKIMRYLLVDAARRRSADKRSGGLLRAELNDQIAAPQTETETILGVHRALEELVRLEPRWVRVVECRFFAGLSDAETGEVLELSDRTVRRDWLKAKAWLHTRLGSQSLPLDSP